MGALVMESDGLQRLGRLLELGFLGGEAAANLYFNAAERSWKLKNDESTKIVLLLLVFGIPY